MISKSNLKEITFSTSLFENSQISNFGEISSVLDFDSSDQNYQGKIMELQMILEESMRQQEEMKIKEKMLVQKLREKKNQIGEILSSNCEKNDDRILSDCVSSSLKNHNFGNIFEEGEKTKRIIPCQKYTHSNSPSCGYESSKISQPYLQSCRISPTRRSIQISARESYLSNEKKNRTYQIRKQKFVNNMSMKSFPSIEQIWNETPSRLSIRSNQEQMKQCYRKHA